MGILRLSDFRQFPQGPSQRPDSDSKSFFICYFAPFQKCSAILDHPSGRWNSAQSHCLSLLGLIDAALVFVSGCPEPLPFATYLLLVCVCVCVCVCVRARAHVSQSAVSNFLKLHISSVHGILQARILNWEPFLPDPRIKSSSPTL